MRNKNDDEAAPAPDQELEERVDKMMDVRQPDGDVSSELAKPEQSAADDVPPLDIFSDAKTAPAVPTTVLKDAGLKPLKTSEQSTEPVPDAEIPAAVETEPEATTYDDPKTEKAVDDIAASDSDKVLAAEDATVITRPPAKQHHFRGIFKKWWLWLILLLVLLGVLYSVPFTRYKIAGFFITEPYQVTVLDSTTNLPVSNVTVKLDGVSATTNDQGTTSLRVSVGRHTLTVHKQYYKDDSEDVLVTLPPAAPASGTVHLQATGRQVPVTVLDKITGKPVSNAEVRVLDTKAVTDGNGKTVIVLPTGKSTLAGTIDASGYNETGVSVQVTNKIVTANTFNVTPVGRVYFLSNQSGQLDVVSTNLDGSDRRTVLAGTGNEDPHNTVLMASRDWKYVALLSQRDANGQAKLSLIDTTHNNAVSTIDDSDAQFQPIGWDNDYFVYASYHTDVPAWKPDASNLKSYDAVTHKAALLDYTQAEGTNTDDAKFESLSTQVRFLGQRIVYDKNWYQSPGYLSVPGKQNTLLMIDPDGSDKKVISKLDAGSSYFGGLYQDEANSLIVQVSPESGGGSGETFYRLTADAAYTKTTDPKVVNAPVTQYPAYLFSETGDRTVWTDERDGKNVVFVSDSSGQNPQIVTTLSTDYTAYGWYGDKYLLLSYKGSELDILPATPGTDRQPLKVTDYFKPDYTYSGYGYGGGL